MFFKSENKRNNKRDFGLRYGKPSSALTPKLECSLSWVLDEIRIFWGKSCFFTFFHTVLWNSPNRWVFLYGFRFYYTNFITHSLFETTYYSFIPSNKPKWQITLFTISPLSSNKPPYSSLKKPPCWLTFHLKAVITLEWY